MAVGGKDKFTKEQRQKATYRPSHGQGNMPDQGYGQGNDQGDSHDPEQGVLQQKTRHNAWPAGHRPATDSDMDDMAASPPAWQKAAARKDSAKNAFKTRQALAEPNALEHQPIDLLRKKARKKHIRGSAAMTQFELIHALRSG